MKPQSHPPYSFLVRSRTATVRLRLFLPELITEMLLNCYSKGCQKHRKIQIQYIVKVLVKIVNLGFNLRMIENG